MAGADGRWQLRWGGGGEEAITACCPAVRTYVCLLARAITVLVPRASPLPAGGDSAIGRYDHCTSACTYGQRGGIRSRLLPFSGLDPSTKLKIGGGGRRAAGGGGGGWVMALSTVAYPPGPTFFFCGLGVGARRKSAHIPSALQRASTSAGVSGNWPGERASPSPLRTYWSNFCSLWGVICHSSRRRLPAFRIPGVVAGRSVGRSGGQFPAAMRTGVLTVRTDSSLLLLGFGDDDGECPYVCMESMYVKSRHS
jgi:hypothetical protein